LIRHNSVKQSLAKTVGLVSHKFLSERRIVQGAIAYARRGVTINSRIELYPIKSPRTNGIDILVVLSEIDLYFPKVASRKGSLPASVWLQAI
jgi:hypothetical protein